MCFDRLQVQAPSKLLEFLQSLHSGSCFASLAKRRIKEVQEPLKARGKGV